MDVGFVLSVVIGLGVAGHAVVGTALTTRLAPWTEPLWSRFGRQPQLLWLNGLLLVVASALHLVVSWVKVAETTGAVFWSSIAPFPVFGLAGILQLRGATGWPHHGLLAAGWLLFAWHASVAA